MRWLYHKRLVAKTIVEDILLLAAELVRGVHLHFEELVLETNSSIFSLVIVRANATEPYYLCPLALRGYVSGIRHTPLVLQGTLCSSGTMKGEAMSYPKLAAASRPGQVRRGLTVLLIGLAAVSGSSCTRCSPAPVTPGPISSETAFSTADAMSAKASKPQYRPGEQIVIVVTLTSRDQKPCHFAGVPDGVVTIVSMTKDGSPIVPAHAEGLYINGFTQVISLNAVVVKSQKTATLSVESAPSGGTSSRPALESSTLTSGDRASIALWPVDQPGAYAAELAYRMPLIELPAPPACQVSSDPVTATFAVSGSSP